MKNVLWSLIRECKTIALVAISTRIMTLLNHSILEYVWLLIKVETLLYLANLTSEYNWLTSSLRMQRSAPRCMQQPTWAMPKSLSSSSSLVKCIPFSSHFCVSEFPFASCHSIYNLYNHIRYAVPHIMCDFISGWLKLMDKAWVTPSIFLSLSTNSNSALWVPEPSAALHHDSGAHTHTYQKLTHRGIKAGHERK